MVVLYWFDMIIYASKSIGSPIRSLSWPRVYKIQYNLSLDQCPLHLRFMCYGNLIGEFGPAAPRWKALTWWHCVNRKDCCGGRCDVVFQELVPPVSSSERNSHCFSVPRHFGSFHIPNFGSVPVPVHEGQSWIGDTRLVWKNLTGTLREMTKWCPTSLSDLRNAPK